MRHLLCLAAISISSVVSAPALQADIITGTFSGVSDNLTNSVILADGHEFAFGFSYDDANVASAGSDQSGNSLQHRVTISDFSFNSRLEDINDNVIYRTSYNGTLLVRMTDLDVTSGGTINVSAEFLDPINLNESSFSTPDQLSQNFSIVDIFDFSLDPNDSPNDAFGSFIDLLTTQSVDPGRIVQQTILDFDGNGDDSGFASYDAGSYSVTVTSVPEPSGLGIVFSIMILFFSRRHRYAVSFR